VPADGAGGAPAAPAYPTRTVTYVYPLSLRIGPKATRVVETQTYSFTTPAGRGDGGAAGATPNPTAAPTAAAATNGTGVLVEYSGHNVDVPFGDTFRTQTAIALTPSAAAADGVADDGTAAATGAPPSTLAVVSVGVHFTRSFPLRGKVERGAREDSTAAYRELLALAGAHLATSGVVPGGGAGVRRRRSGRHRRKGSASGAPDAPAMSAAAVASASTRAAAGVAAAAAPGAADTGAAEDGARAVRPAALGLAAAAVARPGRLVAVVLAVVAVAGLGGVLVLAITTVALVRGLRADVALLAQELAALRGGGCPSGGGAGGAGGGRSGGAVNGGACRSFLFICRVF